jgi:hypothetical protein
MPTVRVNYDNLKEGAKVEIPYLGVFENGSTTEVDQRKWDRFVANWPSAGSLEGDTLELGTESANKASESHADAVEAIEREHNEQVGTPTSEPGLEASKQHNQPPPSQPPAPNRDQLLQQRVAGNDDQES